MTRVTPMLIIGIFLTTLIIVPSVFAFGGSDALANIDGSFESEALISQMPHNARVAIYDEDNTTTPVYSSAYYLTNNISEITTLLEDAGHSVDALTEEDILNRELLTANYDVFIMVNNVPRPSIINHIKEFWMGGGSILSFNSAISYLCYAGILDPTSSDDEYISMWIYGETSVQNVTARHPTMKAYHVNDSVTERTRDWVMTSTIVLDNIDLYSNPIGLLSDWNFTILVSGFALDQCDNGGRVVQLPGDGYSVPTDFESIIIDSVEWLIPKPKGRIVYDLTHSPRLSVDLWDYTEGLATTWSSTHRYTDFRDSAVYNGFTFDKLYPSVAGNLTAGRLSNYDVLMVCWPDLNYTAAEIAAVEDWVANGGSLLVMGDRNGLMGPNPGDIAINELLQNFDMSLGTTNIENYAVMSPGTHYTLESCDSLTIGWRNHLVVLSNATGIWFDGSYPVVAGQEFGDGRAILSADMNIFDNDSLNNNTIEYDNRIFGLNVLNWLTSNDAEILVFASYGGFNADVITALRDLGHSYQAIFTDDYIDDFIDAQEWALVILDQSYYWFTLGELDAIYAYVNDGGKMIMSYFDVDGTSTHPVWSKIGVEYSADISGTPELFTWESDHRIFTEPNDLDGANLTSGVSFTDDGDTLTVLEGYTALAGSSATAQDGNAYIVLSNDYQTLYNGYLIDACITDEDDSTYRDSVELWQNEIAFMLNPPGSGGFTLPFDIPTLLIIGGAIVGVIVIGALAMRRRGSGTSKPKKRSTKKKK